MGLRWQELVHPDDLPGVIAWLNDPEMTVAFGPDGAISFRARRLSGLWVTVYYAKTPHPDGWMVVAATTPLENPELPAPPCIATLCFIGLFFGCGMSELFPGA